MNCKFSLVGRVNREREREMHNNTEQCIPLQQYNSTQPSHTFTSLTHTNTHPAAVTQTWLERARNTHNLRTTHQNNPVKRKSCALIHSQDMFRPLKAEYRVKNTVRAQKCSQQRALIYRRACVIMDNTS